MGTNIKKLRKCANSQYRNFFDGMGTLSLFPENKKSEFKILTPNQRMENSFKGVIRSFYKAGDSIDKAFFKNK